MKESILFQSIMMNLQHFWAEQGCLIWQPYYTQVGAGTYNPATYFRVLGPEPWKVGYVEPSIRPDDGRYGENPNRLQQHYQFQVILKPDPGNPQEIYLKSLEALGIDPRKHDIRFVEDNWESPALGAWGLGWEVWLDGQEITQYTYFQQAGGITLETPSVEITYGLERIALTLQHVRNFREIVWSPDRTYGDVNLQAEEEHSKYYFEIGDIDRLRKMFDLFEGEALATLENGLVLPAHDYILKCSHTFNILDTRGAIGVTERQQYFRRMRDLSRKSAEAYLEQRKNLGFPWYKKDQSNEKLSAPHQAIVSNHLQSESKESFLLEIGTEELPVGDLKSALEQLKTRIPELFADLRLRYDTVEVTGTPRRLVIHVTNLNSHQKDNLSIIKGPPASRAYDAEGKPTKAAVGFAQSKGIGVNDLEVREMDGGSYVVATVHQQGQPTIQVLSTELPALIESLRFERNIRWNTSNVTFSRPIRWLLALYGEQVIHFTYAGLNSGASTRGLRFHEPGEFIVRNAGYYFQKLSSQGIILDPEVRKAAIKDQVLLLMADAGGIQELDESLLEEVANLVEAPTAALGTFKQEHLTLPKEVLVSVMKKHQRYFPVQAKNGDLLPYFITVRNGDREYLDTVVDGNEQVINARFSDAAFFIMEDLKQKLEDFLPRLSTLTFQHKLGSMLEKTKRIQTLSRQLNPANDQDEQMNTAVERAALLCKADLVTHMVVEMTSLQGVMGQFYALKSGESADVAAAIREHYLPRFSGDAGPKTMPGLIVGLADRLDSLAGLFAAGLAPSSNKDPFGLRRAALGLVQSLIEWNLDFDIRSGLEKALDQIPIDAPSQILDDCVEFISMRLFNMLIDAGNRHDVVSAVLAAQKTNPAAAFKAVEQLGRWVERENWMEILPAYSRCVRITRDQGEIFSVDPGLLVEMAEKTLYQGILQAEMTPREKGSVDEVMQIIVGLIPAINQFFNEVLVMADDARLSQNRLGLLQRISSMTDGVAALSYLEGF